MALTPINSGWIEVICGGMFSGKTEELMRRLRRAEIAKMSISIFKPKLILVMIKVILLAIIKIK